MTNPLAKELCGYDRRSYIWRPVSHPMGMDLYGYKLYNHHVFDGDLFRLLVRGFVWNLIDRNNSIRSTWE